MRSWAPFGVVSVLLLLGACATANLPPDDEVVDLPDRGGQIPPDDAAPPDTNPGDTSLPDTSSDPDADSGPGGFKVFVTSTLTKGNLAGPIGGDVFCKNLAMAAGLNGNWAAWLSTNANNVPSIQAIDRVTSAGPWRLVSGEIVATTKAELISGTLKHAIDHDEKGVAVVASRVWTGTGPTGQYLTNDCDKWTNGGNGRTGATDALDQTWTSTNVDDCGNLRHLYCFQL
jgi:hypothetical protein